MVFMPVLTLMLYKAIDKTKHRRLVPDMKNAGNLLLRTRIPLLILALLVAVPCFLAQSNTEFIYGLGSVTATSRAGEDLLLIDEVRQGKSSCTAGSRDDAGKGRVSADLSEIPHVTSVVSVTAVGAEIPRNLCPGSVAAVLFRELLRFILYTDTAEEGEEAFAAVQAVMDTAAMYYDTYYLAGQSATSTTCKRLFHLIPGGSTWWQ